MTNSPKNNNLRYMAAVTEVALPVVRAVRKGFLYKLKPLQCWELVCPWKFTLREDPWDPLCRAWRAPGTLVEETGSRKIGQHQPQTVSRKSPCCIGKAGFENKGNTCCPSFPVTRVMCLQEIRVNQALSKIFNPWPTLLGELTSEKEELMVEISDTF